MVGGLFTLTCFPFMKTHIYFFCLSAFAFFRACFCAAVSFFFTFAMAYLFYSANAWDQGREAERPLEPIVRLRLSTAIALVHIECSIFTSVIVIDFNLCTRSAAVD